MLARYNVCSCCGDKSVSVVIPVSPGFDETDDNDERAEAVRCAGYDPGARCNGCYNNAYHAEFVGFEDGVRYLLAVTNVPDSPDYTVTAIVPSDWIPRVRRAVRDIARVPVGQVAEEGRSVTIQPVKRILRGVANAIPREFLRGLPFGATLPAFSDCAGESVSVDYAVVIDFAECEVRAATVENVECVRFDDLDEWVGS